MDISIIIPSFNDVRIERTVKSILSQTYSRAKYEIIIVDGGSPPNEFEGTLKYLRDVCDIVISEKDDGIFDGLNKGIDLASGDLLYMIGSDDFLISDDVFSMANTEFRENNADLIIFELFYVNNNNIIERHWSLPKNIKQLPAHFQIPHFSTFMSKSLVGVTKFNLDAFISADFGFFKELIKKKRKVSIVNQPIVCMTSGGQSSKNLMNIVKGNIQSLKQFNFNPYRVFRFIAHKIYTKTIHYSKMKFNRLSKEQFQAKINSFLQSIE